jgi:hypothetical protein
MDTKPSELDQHTTSTRPILDAKWDARSTFSIEEARSLLAPPEGHIRVELRCSGRRVVCDNRDADS